MIEKTCDYAGLVSGIEGSAAERRQKTAHSELWIATQVRNKSRRGERIAEGQWGRICIIDILGGAGRVWGMARPLNILMAGGW